MAAPVPFDDGQAADVNSFQKKMYDRENGCIADQVRSENQTKYCPSGIRKNKQFDQMHWPVLSDGEGERIGAVGKMDVRVGSDEPMRQAVKRGDPTA